METGKRIIVIGCSGSGKSVFSRKLHDKINIPLYHLDNIWWKPDRTHITRDEFDRRLSTILKEEEWIIDGNYSRTYEVRFQNCDTVIFLDYSEEQCMAGITERLGKVREDIPWTEDELDPVLVKMVRGFHDNERVEVYQLMDKYPDRTYIILSSREEGDRWLESI